MSVITLTDERIITYFNANPALNAEKIMNMVIDMLENINNDFTQNLSAKMIANMANQIKLLDGKLDQVSTHTQNITNIISILQSQKESLLGDIRMVMKNNTSDYTKEISSIVKENNTLFITTMKDKLLTITNPDLREKIQSDISKSLESVKRDVDKLLQQKINDINIKIYMENMNLFVQIKSHIQSLFPICFYSEYR